MAGVSQAFHGRRFRVGYFNAAGSALTRHALRYVLCNRKHHAPQTRFDKFWIDPFSSGPWFTGWAAPIRSQRDLARDPKPTADATVWLLTTGWKRNGPLRFDECPS